MILYIDGILAPYQVARYNALHKDLGRPIQVWFQSRTESFRGWQKLPPIKFAYQILPVKTWQFFGQDTLNLRFNYGYLPLLEGLKTQLERIVVTGWDQPICLLVLKWARKNGITVTLRAGSTVNERSWLRSLTGPYVKWLVPQFDDYIAYGTASAEYLVSLGAKPSKIFKFYNTVDVDYFHNQHQKLFSKREKIRASLGLKKNTFTLVANGRFVPRKKFDQLITVFSGLLAAGYEVQLVILGSGPELQKCQLLAGPHLNSQIFLPGFIQHQDLSKYYAVADLFVLPSSVEVWGLVVNEAMASHVPVLVADTAGCVPDLLAKSKKTNCFQAGDSHDLKSQIVKFLDLYQAGKLDKLRSLSWQEIKPFTIENNIKRIQKFWRIY